MVASFNFPESELLAAIYGLAIRQAGIPVRFQLDLGPRKSSSPRSSRAWWTWFPSISAPR